MWLRWGVCYCNTSTGEGLLVLRERVHDSHLVNTHQQRRGPATHNTEPVRTRAGRTSPAQGTHVCVCLCVCGLCVCMCVFIYVCVCVGGLLTVVCCLLFSCRCPWRQPLRVKESPAVVLLSWCNSCISITLFIYTFIHIILNIYN